MSEVSMLMCRSLADMYTSYSICRERDYDAILLSPFHAELLISVCFLLPGILRHPDFQQSFTFGHFSYLDPLRTIQRFEEYLAHILDITHLLRTNKYLIMTFTTNYTKYKIITDDDSDDGDGDDDNNNSDKAG